nr:hypothetical protein [Tanacetum cinerariifolium]
RVAQHVGIVNYAVNETLLLEALEGAVERDAVGIGPDFLLNLGPSECKALARKGGQHSPAHGRLAQAVAQQRLSEAVGGSGGRSNGGRHTSKVGGTQRLLNRIAWRRVRPPATFASGWALPRRATAALQLAAHRALPPHWPARRVYFAPAHGGGAAAVRCCHLAGAAAPAGQQGRFYGGASFCHHRAGTILRLFFWPHRPLARRAYVAGLYGHLALRRAWAMAAAIRGYLPAHGGGLSAERAAVDCISRYCAACVLPRYAAVAAAVWLAARAGRAGTAGGAGHVFPYLQPPQLARYRLQDPVVAVEPAHGGRPAAGRLGALRAAVSLRFYQALPALDPAGSVPAAASAAGGGVAAPFSALQRAAIYGGAASVLAVAGHHSALLVYAGAA